MPPRRRAKGVVRKRVGVEGLPEFIKDLNLAPAQTKQVDRLFRMYAANTVADDAKDRARNLGSVAAKAEPDLRVTGLGRVTLSGNAYDMGAEFGSYQYKQFKRWRGNDDDAGYFFWPSIRDYREKAMTDDYIKFVWKTVDAVGSS